PPKNKGGNSVLQRICRNSHRFNIKIQILVGKVMALYGSRCGIKNAHFQVFCLPLFQNKVAKSATSFTARPKT
ncbi:hypothetical protein, partial [Leptospira kirschneri]|uniref:hypothetical protein n=1 Tax=Leptospira kirschneri TaxID=29507 RepID=UPI001C4DEEAC